MEGERVSEPLSYLSSLYGSDNADLKCNKIMMKIRFYSLVV